MRRETLKHGLYLEASPGVASRLKRTLGANMRRLLKTVLPLGVLSFLAVVAVALWSVQTLENAIRIEKDAIIVQDIVGDLSQQLQIAESSQRSFLLTGNNDYLRAHTQAIPKVPGIMKRLRRVTAGVPEEEKIVRQIDKLVSKKLEEIKLTVILRKASKNEEAIAITNTDQGQQLMIEIFDLLNQLDHKAELDAIRHEGFVQRYSTLLKFSIAVGSLISLSLVLLFAGLSRKEIRQRRQNEESLKKAEQAALVASNMKSRFLSTISHEIRTPLNGIIGMSDLLRDRIQDSESRRYSDIIHQSSLALLRIVNDLLDFSKIEAGKIEFELSRLSCLNLVETAAELYSAKASEKGITLLTYVDPSIPADLLGDSSRISQVLRNLIANAVKFTADGGVLVRAYHHLEAGSKVLVRFEIQDTGIGIAEKMRPHIFEPFQQFHHQNRNPQLGDSATQSRGRIDTEGTGLGLSICKGLVEQMGGSIGFTPGSTHGSIFWFEIPLKIQNQEDRISTPSLSAPTLDAIVAFNKNSPLTETLSLYAAEAGLSLNTQTELKPINTPTALVFIYSDDYPDAEVYRFLQVHFARESTSETSKISPVVFLTNQRFKERDVLREFPLTYLRTPFTRQRLQETLIETLAKVPAEVLLSPSTSTYATATSAFANSLSESGSRASNSRLVLLVEDNSTNQLVAESYLKKYGCQVHTVANGEEALMAMEKCAYQIVFMDCQMPVMDGFEATEKIRQREVQHGTHIPIIAMTANAMNEDRQRCLAAGMDGFLSKPLQPIELEKILLQWINYHGAEFVDWAQLRKLANDTNSEVVKQLITSYQSTLQQSMSKIEAAVKSADLDGIRRTAHQLRASSATLGAIKLSELCQTLEFQAERTLQLHDLTPAVRELLQEAENVGHVFAEQTLFA